VENDVGGFGEMSDWHDDDIHKLHASSIAEWAKLNPATFCIR
jgi:hypothetical protein